MNLRLSDKQFGMLLALPGFVFLIIFIAYPVGYNFVISFLQYNPLLETKFVGIKNYIDLFHDELFLHSLKIMAIYAIGSFSITFTIGIIQAHTIGRLKGGSKTSTVYRVLTILSWSIPLIITAFFWKSMFSPKSGVINYLLTMIGFPAIQWTINPDMALLSCIIADAWRRIPLMFLLVLAGLQGIPGELYEAAEIDGADIFARFRHISFPINRPAVMKASLLSIMAPIMSVAVIFGMTSGGPARGTYTTSLHLFSLINQYLKFSKAAAVGNILLIITVIIALPIIIWLVRD